MSAFFVYSWNIHLAAYGIAIVLLGVAFILAKLFELRNYVNRVDKLPGPRYTSVLGHAPKLFNRADRFQHLVELLSDYMGKPLARIWIGNEARVFLLNSVAAEVLLSSTRFLDKDKIYDFIHPWLGQGLLTSSGSKWHSRRKMITPSFHFRIFEDFQSVFNEQGAILAEKLDANVGGEAFDVYPYLTLCTLNVICETAMGVSIDAQSNKDSRYVKTVYSTAEIIVHRIGRPWLHPNWAFSMSRQGRQHNANIKILHDFTNKVIRERRLERRELIEKSEDVGVAAENQVFGRKRRMAFLDLLLHNSENGYELSDEDIREEVDTFMFEGHDTTATGMAWVIYCIGRHPRVQQQLHEELDRIFGDSDRPVTDADLRELKYLECIIKEGLRMFPPVPFFGRKLKEDLTVLDHVIPVGTNVGIYAYFLHRDPTVFPNPDQFDPDRFSSENCIGRHAFSYVPFSAGPRNCIGQKFAMMEEKIVLAHIFRRLKVASIHSLSEMKLLSEMVLRPLDGIWLKVEHRDKTLTIQ